MSRVYGIIGLTMVREISVRDLAPYLRVPIVFVQDILRFIVLSTGRCGSGSVSAALTELGIPCGHEFFFNPGTAHLHFDEIKGLTTDLVGESSWLAVGWLDEIPEELPLFHLVRHPIKYINSLTSPPGYWAGAGGPHALFKQVGLEELRIPGKPEEEYSMIHWLRWNQMIEERVSERRRYRVEDQNEKMLLDISHVMQRDVSDKEVKAAIKAGREVRENRHRMGGAIFQTDHLRDFELFPEFAAKAEEYGYDLDEAIA